MSKSPAINEVPATVLRQGSGRRVYCLLLSGSQAQLEEFMGRRFPDHDWIMIGRTRLREAGFWGQIRVILRLRGEAFVIFVDSLADLEQPTLTAWSGALSRCRTTILADSGGAAMEYGRWSSWRLLPRTIVSGFCDSLVLIGVWVALKFSPRAKRTMLKMPESTDMDLAYLCPNPYGKVVEGGALSHMRGFLSGWASVGGRCEIFSGGPLPVQDFPVRVVVRKRTMFLFRESLLLSYNIGFAWAVYRLLRGRKVSAIYQRHGRFAVAGMLLSKILCVPLILEYNASELRMAAYGDAVRFARILRACEDAAIAQASLIVVVSETLRHELLGQGVDDERILVNPNGVDPDLFRPNAGGDRVRARMGLKPSDVVVAFVGSFSYWHGITVLEQAILRLLKSENQEIRFLLVGDGPLCADMRASIEPVGNGRVLFTGRILHEDVPAYLDAADILVSPHTRMPDGLPFFGSPTKLFEYMAMRKAIVASDLEQLSRVLRHRQSGWLVEPGNPAELTAAILLLAKDVELRETLGRNARSAALAHYTWRQNAGNVMHRARGTSVAATASLDPVLS